MDLFRMCSCKVENRQPLSFVSSFESEEDKTAYILCHFIESQMGVNCSIACSLYTIVAW